MKPWLHAKSSAQKFGGKSEDYLDIHNFMDSSKAHVPDMRHRAILHSSFGCFIVEQVFGVTRTNSDGKEYSTRDIAEQHCLEDLGRIPTVQDYLEGMPMYDWLGGPKTTKRTISMDQKPEKEIFIDGSRPCDLPPKDERFPLSPVERESIPPKQQKYTEPPKPKKGDIYFDGNKLGGAGFRVEDSTKRLEKTEEEQIIEDIQKEQKYLLSYIGVCDGMEPQREAHQRIEKLTNKLRELKNNNIMGGVKMDQRNDDQNFGPVAISC